MLSGAGGYPRMTEDAEGNLFMGVDAGDGLRLYKSTNDGVTWGAPVVAVQHPYGANAYVANVFPLVLSNGDMLMAYRQLNDTDNHEAEPDGIYYYNIGVSKSTDGGVTWTEVSRALDFLTPADKSMGAWEPFLYEAENNEVWCLYSRQNEGRDLHPLWLNMKRSTDGGVTWGAEEVVVGTDQFGPLGSAGMAGLVRTASGKIIVVFETQDPVNNNWFSIGMVTSVDNGATWSQISTVYTYPSAGNIYGAGAPYISELPGGELIVSHQYGAGGDDTNFGYVISEDDGETWSDNHPMWQGETHLWNAVYVSRKGLIYAVTSGVKYKIGTSGDVQLSIKPSFYLYPKHTNRLVVDANIPVPAENGNNVHTWERVDFAAYNHFWVLHDKENGYFTLEPTSSSFWMGNKVLTTSPLPDPNCILWDDEGGDNQLWSAEATEDGYYKIISKETGYVLTVLDAGTAPGTNVITTEDAGEEFQQFTGVSVGDYYDPFADWINAQN